MSVPEEKLAGVDQALAELGKSDAEVTEVRSRFRSTTAVDLQSVDGELGTLSSDFSFEGESTELKEARPAADTDPVVNWEDEHTDVEILDESDFVLLVDENELEALEKAGEDDAMPAEVSDSDQAADGEGSFFKKLFGGRRNSSSP